jgi:hypothetical protein
MPGIEEPMAISPRKLTIILSVAIVGLICTHIATQALQHLFGHDHQFGLIAFFNLDKENNPGSWYSSSTLLLCALLLGAIGLAKRETQDRHALQWLGLSVLFMYLSLDEAVGIHELASDPIEERFQTTGYLYYAWVIPGGLFTAVVSLLYLRFLAALPTSTRRLFVISGLIYVSGALGVEMLGGRYASLHGDQNLGYALFVALEEGLEMTGIAVFLYALSSYMAANGIEVRFAPERISQAIIPHAELPAHSPNVGIQPIGTNPAALENTSPKIPLSV